MKWIVALLLMFGLIAPSQAHTWPATYGPELKGFRDMPIGAVFASKEELLSFHRLKVDGETGYPKLRVVTKKDPENRFTWLITGTETHLYDRSTKERQWQLGVNVNGSAWQVMASGLRFKCRHGGWTTEFCR